MNLITVFALTLGILMILVTQKLDGGSISALIQPSAFFVVIGGTFCASLLNFSPHVLLNAFYKAREVFYHSKNHEEDTISEIIQVAQYTRMNGLLAAQDIIANIKNPFFSRGLQLAIDVNNNQIVKDILSAEISYEEEEELINSRVFETLGGYAPTFGVVGAVMGLIHVMENIDNIELLGTGIATAFVATLYGVGLANLILLPIAGNLKQKLREKILIKEIILQGVLSIQLQENPAIIEEKLISYFKFHNKGNYSYAL